MKKWKNNLILPIIPRIKNVEFFDGNSLIAVDYERIVIGERGPYIEFNDEQINKKSICIPIEESWRNNSPLAFYIEYRTMARNIMVYYQKRIVNYADYKVGMWYISPWDLTSYDYPVLITGTKPKHVL